VAWRRRAVSWPGSLQVEPSKVADVSEATLTRHRHSGHMVSMQRYSTVMAGEGVDPAGPASRSYDREDLTAEQLLDAVPISRPA
jgi:hypothetical protein